MTDRTSSADANARFVDRLDPLLTEAESPSTRDWWERYLKGAAQFRGVKMAAIRRAVDTLVVELELDVSDPDLMLGTAELCFARPTTEDKLAGVLLLAEHGLGSLTVEHVGRLAHPLMSGQLADWNSCDWFCVKVLGPFVTAGGDGERDVRARAVADWRTADSLWARRASAVSFVNHAATEPELFAGFTDLLLTVCAANAADPTRWSQTSVGWLLRELSSRCPTQVARFLAEHPELSTEARKAASSRLP